MIAYRGIDAFNRREFSILVRNGDKIVLAYNKYAKEWWNIDQEWRDCSLEKEWYLTPPSIKILGDPSPIVFLDTAIQVIQTILLRDMQKVGLKDKHG